MTSPADCCQITISADSGADGGLQDEGGTNLTVETNDPTFPPNLDVRYLFEEAYQQPLADVVFEDDSGAETMQIDRVVGDPSRIEIVSDKVFARYRDKLGAAVGVSLHMGNWELAIWPLTLAGANPAAVYRSVNNPYVDRYLRSLRRDLYPGGLLGKGRINGSREEGQKTARLITDFVRRGGRLGLVCDLYDRTGIPVPFFGKPAPSVAIAGMIARRVGARIWLSRCRRLGRQSRFAIEIKELKVPRTASAAEDVTWVTAAMQRQFEAWIRENPEQWMWSNRRWS